MRELGLVASLFLAGLMVLSACSGSSPPEAAFAVEGESGSAPLRVQFTDTSEGSVESWEWDFGDGATSTEQNPTHEYTEAGSFTVSLTATNSDGEGELNVADAVSVEPGAFAELLVSDEAMVAVTESVQLEGSAADEFGNEIEDAEFAWSTSENFPLSVGSVDDEGLFTAGTEAGLFDSLVDLVVSDGSETMSSSFDIVVEPGEADSVGLEPAEVVLDIGGTQAFTVSAWDEFGNEVNDPELAWSMDPDNGELNSDGVFTAGTVSGPAAVVVEIPAGATAGASVNILPGPLATAEVQPVVTAVRVGESVTFTAMGLDQYGNQIPDPTVAWSATVGQIDAGGNYVGSSAGDHTVTATLSSGEVQATAIATAQTPTEGRLRIFSDTTLTANHLGGIDIVADGVTLDCAGHLVQGPGLDIETYGILADGRRGVTLLNCSVSESTTGIALINSHDNTLSGNYTYDGVEGIYLGGSTGNTISENRSDSNRYDGFLLQNSENNLIIRNEAAHNGSQFSLEEGANSNRVVENVATLPPGGNNDYQDIGAFNVFENNQTVEDGG